MCALRKVSGLWRQPSIHCVPVNQVNKDFYLFFLNFLGGQLLHSYDLLWDQLSGQKCLWNPPLLSHLQYQCCFNHVSSNNLLSTIPKERSWGDDIKVWVGWFGFVHVCLGFGKERHFSLALFFSWNVAVILNNLILLCWCQENAWFMSALCCYRRWNTWLCMCVMSMQGCLIQQCNEVFIALMPHISRQNTITWPFPINAWNNWSLTGFTGGLQMADEAPHPPRAFSTHCNWDQVHYWCFK